MSANARVSTRTGPLGHERITVREFRDRGSMHAFLNRADNATRWTEYTGPLAPGIYAYAGSEWRNVKALPKGLLPHV